MLIPFFFFKLVCIDSKFQKFEKGDYRLVRFMNSTKLVNPNIAIDLIAAVPPKSCKESVVWCDGGGSLGHPKVYINLVSII